MGVMDAWRGVLSLLLLAVLAGAVQAGENRKPPVVEQAALFLSADGRPAVERLTVNAGYNFGLVAIRRQVHVEAGASVALPVLFIAVDRGPAPPAKPTGAGVTFATTLAALRSDLLRMAEARQPIPPNPASRGVAEPSRPMPK